MPPETFLRNLNPELPSPDFLYHLGLDTAGDHLGELQRKFGNVVHVAMMGSDVRAFRFARELASATGGSHLTFGQDASRTEERHFFANEVLDAVMDGRLDPLEAVENFQDWLARSANLPRTIGKTERYWMFGVDLPGDAGRVLVANHHMGQPTHAILLHEMTKLLHHAGADRQNAPFEFTRLGTSGGLGVPAGTVVVADRGLEPTGKAQYRLFSLGEEVILGTEFDARLSSDIFNARAYVPGLNVVRGSTVACDDFYIVQGRLDGAFRMADANGKSRYLNSLHEKGARNMEMEAAGFAAFTAHMGIPAACVGVTLLNRLEGDQVTSTPQELAQFSEGPQRLLIAYLQNKFLTTLND